MTLRQWEFREDHVQCGAQQRVSPGCRGLAGEITYGEGSLGDPPGVVGVGVMMISLEREMSSMRGLLIVRCVVCKAI
jgi:hypothetical protein